MLRIVVPALMALALAGCIGSPQPVDPSSTLPEVPEVEMPEGPFTDQIAGDIMVSTATPVRTLNNGGAFTDLLTPGGNITGFVLEVVWEATAPSNQQLSLWVRPAGVGNVDPANTALVTGAGEPTGKVDGPSPLRLALPAEAFTEEGDYEWVVRASAAPVGVAANQPFTVYLTTFDGVPFDEAYTALGEAEAEA